MYKDHKKCDPDPLQRILGPIFNLLKNKYYIDEIYQFVFIWPAVGIANFCGKFDYDWVINPIVNAVGRIGVILAEASSLVDKIGIDTAGVHGVAGFFNWSGKQLRLTQSGNGQSYVMVLSLAALALVSVYLIFLL